MLQDDMGNGVPEDFLEEAKVGPIGLMWLIEFWHPGMATVLVSERELNGSYSRDSTVLSHNNCTCDIHGISITPIGLSHREHARCVYSYL